MIIMTFSMCDYLTRVLCGVFAIVACVLYKAFEFNGTLC